MKGDHQRSGKRSGAKPQAQRRQNAPGRDRHKGASSARASAPRGLDSVHGVHAVETLLMRQQVPSELWIQEGQAEKRLADIQQQASALGARVVLQSREVLDQIAEGAHQGVIAFCEPLVADNESSLFWQLEANVDQAPLLLVLDGVTDVHNFGACLRSADAAGVIGVMVAKDRSAPLNATVRKISCGGAESVPVYQVTNLARALARLKEYGMQVLGAAGEADTFVHDVDMRGPTALVMGAEGKGLRRLTREHCDQLVKLPMAGQVSSLNVSVATGICLFEAVRQRRPH
ncbi:23S rRNA (guanosine(2251)-2'-O)-methyltransferase RlmB [Kushneria marisflavi]|uniref:23S rRNA (Guanosine(2251)-2'-O)-methyltransferase RlmB n=1 Tax=Kushneria marisflavi TaxID=157779 RepID=A0A240UMF0_9GAMM|nr:23S rRNA (guanosine(2251)-2'-O)-methyltransferase RlmB [Kushneria marisflavi]ART62199.1 23S rRNA (guanosine(2251)-2'-O)-methyltransferase RlmB [Kushneria marisflavi]RKD87282.1 23S rRNA Gm-2251 2'-O-methyltransferase [Kushneria marisflavi]